MRSTRRVKNNFINSGKKATTSATVTANNKLQFGQIAAANCHAYQVLHAGQLRCQRIHLKCKFGLHLLPLRALRPFLSHPTPAAICRTCAAATAAAAIQQPSVAATLATCGDLLPAPLAARNLLPIALGQHVSGQMKT